MSAGHASAELIRDVRLAGELRVLVGRLSRRLREQGQTEDLTSSQQLVLLRLESGGSATVTALARAEGVRPQSMGATVATLEGVGLVSGTPDSADGRQILLSLTPACREKIKASRAAREDWLAKAIQSRFALGEREALASAVALLRRLIEP